MTTLHRVVTTKSTTERVFDYLADFQNATEWDSGTVSCVRLNGDGDRGTVYRNVSRFAGREVSLDYTVEHAAYPRFVIVGQNRTTTSRDTILVRPYGSGTEVDYTAEFTFTGPARFLGPLMKPLLNRLGDRTAEQLVRALDALS